MISRQDFGRSGYPCSRVIFGAWALNNATQEKVINTLQILDSHGVNCIDTAPMYGNVEKIIGSSLTKKRKDYFIATKSRSRSYKGALKNLKQSLENLQVEYIDLWQMHGLTNPAGWKKAMEPDGALEAFIEAQEKGIVRYLGVTGHGYKAPMMHKRSLERYDFDSVMLPYNYALMQDPRYEADFIELAKICEEREVAIQTIKSIARRPWGGLAKTHDTYFYEPLVDQSSIDKAVHWALGLENSFVVSVGDLELLPRVLDAASRYRNKPSENEMNEMVTDLGVQSIWSSPRKVKGRHTWGGKMSKLLDELIEEGFFKDPKRNSVEEVLEALQISGLPSMDKRKNVATALARRARNGRIEREKTINGWLYWTK